ncbi:acetate/propionate family kinase [Sandaracinobacteroides sp. A072]|uniref:acetate/propionate family kinase n=1 Tax=Sandaracinobacteroides sp. A072 TaxID=3461146 RepID=UPI004041A347
MMETSLISINAGSSSIKFALFTADGDSLAHAGGGKLEGIGTAPRLTAFAADGSPLVDRHWPGGNGESHESLLAHLLDWVKGQLPGRTLAAVGHRIVHGGRHFHRPRRVDDTLVAALEQLVPLAPLHQPHNLSALAALRRLLPGVPHVACFDTAFHHDMPETMARLPLPRRYAEKGMRRYGFHGLSYEHVAHSLATTDPALASGRVIAAHLGNGASLCAMRAGKSIDTSMGFTALEGLMMGTRTGSIDPGVILHLIRHEGLAPEEVEQLLYRQSGLLGVSGVSSDMRALHACTDPHAEEAIALFAWRAAREAGGLMVALGGLDGIVFTAGIGENDPDMRARIAAHLAFTGLRLCAHANARNAAIISTPESRVIARVIPADEELMIARHSLAVVRKG